MPGKPDPLPQLENGPKIELETASWPVMSGLTRPSIVGPCELYGSSASDCQQTAPTASAEGDVAGIEMLPAGTAYCSDDPF